MVVNNKNYEGKAQYLRTTSINKLLERIMTKFIKISALLAGAALLTLAACSTASQSQDKQAKMQANHQMMGAEHKAKMVQMKQEHQMMMKMDMSKMDMSKLSPECQAMMSKMKTKMAQKHKDGAMHKDMKDHDMSKMEGHDMMKMGDGGMMKDGNMMKNHDPEKMKTMMAKHKKCMAEMKEAMPHEH